MPEHCGVSRLDRLLLPLRNTKILWRLILLFVITCVCPILLFGSLYQARYTQELRAKIGADSIKLLSMMTERQNDIIDSMERITMKLSGTEQVQQILKEKELSSFDKNRLSLQINKQIEQSVLISPMVKNVAFFGLDGQLVYSMGYDHIDENGISALLPRVEQAYPLEYVTALPEGGNKASIMIIRAVNRADYTGQRLGYLMMEVDERQFAQETYREIYSGEQGQIFLLGDDGTVISSTDPLLPAGQQIPHASVLTQIQEGYAAQNPHFSTALGETGYYCSFTYNSKTKWYAVSLVRDSYLNREMNQLNLFVRLLTLCCIAAGALFLAAITASIVRPTYRLVSYCREVSRQQGGSAIKDTGKDEIGYLTREIGSMVEKLDDYNSREIKNSMERRNLEIQMLQAQINPHFLFNTLNSIKWVAVLSRVPAVADSLSALSGLLKNTIVNKDEFITLREEIENIKNYALIQSLRYTERFSMEYHVAPECFDPPILKFLLQPIVENSIIYGVEETGRPITICVSAEETQSGLRIVIQDNGAGFDTAVLKEKNTSSKRLSGIGIGNVEQRIRLVYGPGAGMTVESHPGTGTVVTMELPETGGKRHV